MRELLSSRTNLHALFIAFGLMLAQQLSGVNIVIFYTADVFQAAGSEIHPDTCAVIIGSVQVRIGINVGRKKIWKYFFQAAVTYLSLLLVDRAGRRILLLCSAIPTLISLIALGMFIT